VECSTEEQNSVVRFFLWAIGHNAKDSHKEVCPVYSGKCLLHKAVYNWVEKFSQGRLKVTDIVRDCDRGNYAAGGIIDVS
jgi:hypothetical protein